MPLIKRDPNIVKSLSIANTNSVDTIAAKPEASVPVGETVKKAQVPESVALPPAPPKAPERLADPPIVVKTEPFSFKPITSIGPSGGVRTIGSAKLPKVTKSSTTTEPATVVSTAQAEPNAAQSLDAL